MRGEKTIVDRLDALINKNQRQRRSWVSDILHLLKHWVFTAKNPQKVVARPHAARHRNMPYQPLSQSSGCPPKGAGDPCTCRRAAIDSQARVVRKELRRTNFKFVGRIWHLPKKATNPAIRGKLNIGDQPICVIASIKGPAKQQLP